MSLWLRGMLLCTGVCACRAELLYVVDDTGDATAGSPTGVCSEAPRCCDATQDVGPDQSCCNDACCVDPHSVCCLAPTSTCCERAQAGDPCCDPHVQDDVCCYEPESSCCLAAPCCDAFDPANVCCLNPVASGC